ncbi:MAG: bifunctional phosphoglucose/phosphomannose isomerase [Hyphomicrobiales bacterium]
MSPAKRRTTPRGATKQRATKRGAAKRSAAPRRRTVPLDDPRLVARLDPGGMGDRIEGLAAQVRAGARLAAPAAAALPPTRPRRLVLFGMGGSAIAGDFLRVLADREGSVPVHVVRHYEPPAWLTPEDFLVFSSYSGETEETLAAYRAARARGARACVVTTGGSLAERARADGVPAAILPAGHPPRAALGYSLSTLLSIADHVGVVSADARRLAAAADAVEGVVSACRRDVVHSRNSAKRLAIRLAGRVLLVIGGERTLHPAAVRWKGQLNENAKQLAWASALPEMNHNEVDSFVTPKAALGRLAVVLLRDPDDHPRVARRFEWLAAYLGRKRVRVETVIAAGREPLARTLSCVALGDFVSYYAALQNGVDPSALPGVETLKKALRG